MAAVFYETIVTYDDASTPYNGNATTYTYSGSITVVLLPKYGLTTAQYYAGMLDLVFTLASTYKKVFQYIPSTSGLSVRMIPNSSMIIRNYKKVKDPIRIGGCCQCGSYLYD